MTSYKICDENDDDESREARADNDRNQHVHLILGAATS